MKFSPTRIINMIVIIIAVFLNYSCSKDSDLLADYVVNENAGNPGNLTDLQDGTIITYEDKMVAINILRDIQSSAARKGTVLKKVTPPKNGKTEIKTDSTIVYTPNKDFTGKDDVVYVVEETAPDNTTIEKQNTVTVAVNPVLETKNDQVQTTADKKVVIPVLKNDTYSDKNTATVTQTTPPAKGTVIINNDNTLTYTPNADASGSDTFTYTVQVENMEKTASTTNKGTVSVTFDNVSTNGPITETDMGELKAFPGAEGFGKNATGGRGGRVIKVTNLNASGPGSFRQAVESSGARTIIFTVGGTIDVGGTININNPDLTIAGETAPGDGILLKNCTLAIFTNNIILKHLRIRGSGGSEQDGIMIKGGSSLYSFNLNNIIIDHCSISWATDENISVINAKNVTIQNCILTGSQYNLLAWSNKDLSILNNIFALSASRSLECNQQLGTYLVFEEINNLIYGYNWAHGIGKGMMGTLENNIYETSSSFSHASDYPISYTNINPDYIETSNPASMTYVYASGNTYNGSTSGVWDPAYPSYIKSTPLYRSTYEPKPIAGLKNELLSNAGAFSWNRDSIDKAVIAHINAKTGTVVKSGTFPTINGGTPYTDSDGDGMSDEWENAKNLNPNDNSDGPKDRNGDGYTNLEEFLYYLTLK